MAGRRDRLRTESRVGPKAGVAYVRFSRVLEGMRGSMELAVAIDTARPGDFQVYIYLITMNAAPENLRVRKRSTLSYRPSYRGIWLPSSR